jgi:hypothetical protein
MIIDSSLELGLRDSVPSNPYLLLLVIPSESSVGHQHPPSHLFVRLVVSVSRMNILLQACHIGYMDVMYLHREDRHSESGYQLPDLMSDLPFLIDKVDMLVYSYRLEVLWEMLAHDLTAPRQAINNQNPLEYKTGMLVVGHHIASGV